MPIYISRGRFTSDAVKGMLAKPENREEAFPNSSRAWEAGSSGGTSLMRRPPPLRYWPLPREAVCLKSRRPSR
jgi:hypothetical protein